MSKMQTQIIQTEYGVYVPKVYNPVTERMTSVAPSIIERAVVALRNLLNMMEHKPTRTMTIHNAKPAK